jgi:hypothetical protein
VRASVAAFTEPVLQVPFLPDYAVVRVKVIFS